LNCKVNNYNVYYRLNSLYDHSRDYEWLLLFIPDIVK